MKPQTKRVHIALIGAGRRARSTVIPAIHAASDWVELAGIHTRSRTDVRLLSGEFRATTRPVADIEWGSVDALVVAIPTTQVPVLLQSLEPIDSGRITLMLDTPVLELPDIAASRYFSRFAEVLASEDCYALPNHVLARRLVNEGTIGQLRQIFFLHSGYRHHALASLHQLTGRRPTWVRIKRWNRGCAMVSLRFPSGVRAGILEPRRYDVGRTMVIGADGFIADYPVADEKGLRIGYRTKDGRYLGLTVDGDPLDGTPLDAAFVERLSPLNLADSSLMNQLKIRGFMELLAGLGDPSSPFRYGAKDAIQNNLSMKLAERVGFYSDIPLGGDRTLGFGAMRFAARVPRLLPRGKLR